MHLIGLKGHIQIFLKQNDKIMIIIIYILIFLILVFVAIIGFKAASTEIEAKQRNKLNRGITKIQKILIRIYSIKLPISGAITKKEFQIAKDKILKN